MLPTGKASSPPVRTVAAELMASEIQLRSDVVSGLSKDARADKLDYLLRQPDGVHEFHEGLGIVSRLSRELPAVLLDSLGGAQEGDDGAIGDCLFLPVLHLVDRRHGDHPAWRSGAAGVASPRGSALQQVRPAGLASAWHVKRVRCWVA
jgi:hypothetical protein